MSAEALGLQGSVRARKLLDLDGFFSVHYCYGSSDSEEKWSYKP